MPKNDGSAAASKGRGDRQSSESGDDHDNDNDQEHEHELDQGNENDGAAPTKRKRLTQACDPCRKKKIKCDGVKPSCANCTKLHGTCSYLPSMKKRGPRQGYIELLEKRLDKMEQLLQHGPAPVDPELLDSKSILSSRLRPGNRRPLSPTGDGGSQSDSNARADPEERYFGTTSGYTLQHTEYDKQSDPNKGIAGPKYSSQSTLPRKERKDLIYGIKDEIPRKDILDHLIELFFDSIYFQLPIIHQGTFMKQYKEGKVSPNLLNAMCAAVARFSNHPDVVTTPAFLAGEPFATNVRGMVVDSIDIPTVSNVQALLFLSMYEYGAARGPRAWMFGGMAMRQAQELGLNREDSSPVFHLKGDWIMRETRRRTFWACFLMDVLASSSSGRPRMIDERDCEVLLPLPSEDHDWYHERPVVAEMLGDGEDSSSGTEHEPPTRCKKQGAGHVLSSFAYLIRILAVLGRVSQYVNRPRSKKAIPPNQRGSEFSVIDAALLAWHKSIPPHLAYSIENAKMVKDKGEGCIIIFMHVIYHTAVVLLHRPILAADKAAFPMDSENSSARCADAASKVSDLLEFVQAYNCPPRIFISAFFAYPVFTTATIHITNAFASDPNVATRARRSLSIHVKILQTMKPYWSM
ncbi:fungal-specific transcription factor domain-containing protein, partial [Dissophora ornata]